MNFYPGSKLSISCHLFQLEYSYRSKNPTFIIQSRNINDFQPPGGASDFEGHVGTVRVRGWNYFVPIVAKTSVTDKSFNLIRPEQVPTDGNDLKILLRDAF